MRYHTLLAHTSCQPQFTLHNGGPDPAYEEESRLPPKTCKMTEPNRGSAHRIVQEFCPILCRNDRAITITPDYPRTSQGGANPYCPGLEFDPIFSERDQHTVMDPDSPITITSPRIPSRGFLIHQTCDRPPALHRIRRNPQLCVRPSNADPAGV